MSSLSYNIYPELNLVFIKATGNISVETFFGSVLAISDDPEFVRGMSTLLDCTESEVPAISREDEQSYEKVVDELTDETARDYKRKLAVLAGENLAAFGVSRMRQVPLSDSLLEMHVFRELEEALDWLELEVPSGMHLSAAKSFDI